MKTKITLTLIVLITITSSCSKIMFDDRNKYCGTYEFTIGEYEDNIATGPGWGQETQVEGRVYYDKDLKDELNHIYITVSDDLEWKCLIDEDGNVSCCGGEGTLTKSGTVNFSFSEMDCDSTLTIGMVYNLVGGKI